MQDFADGMGRFVTVLVVLAAIGIVSIVGAVIWGVVRLLT